MDSLTNRTYLLNQYRDASGLGTRANLYSRFGQSSVDWHRWVFDRLEIEAGDTVLELGCGTGALWSESIARLPTGVDITLSDNSPGMIEVA